ncbi:MAG: type I-B CRISPR-associated protein Cas7/Csh2 [Methanobrevibacter sp.]|jgi:CRISPR-associated protein Csh2|nr:type I-B CRISPR-associated protein Cas7/Csh2 [Candidatus Methanovirga meridionalis]
MSNSEIVKNRSEILFLYDITNANPNGDPLDSNKPRLDEETEFNIVTDVRLKRTIRDYLHDYKKEEIFVREIVNNEGKIQDAKARANDFLNNDNKDNTLLDTDSNRDNTFLGQKKQIANSILEKCIDVRLFGATIPVDIKFKEKDKSKSKTSSVTFTGSVQFRLGRSLHKVEITHIKGTGAFASGEGKEQKTFREEYILPYSLISFYGIVNEKAAESTKLTNEDVKLLLDGIWNGTKNLISRSKFGQVPRLLIQIEYKDKYYFIGDLDKQLSLKHSLDNDKTIRSINEVKINLDLLLKSLELNKDKINRINMKYDSNIIFEDIGDGNDLNKKIKAIGIDVAELKL